MEGAAQVAEELTAVVSESESGIFIIPRKQTDTGKLREQQRKEQAAHLARTMATAYSEDELADLCFAMGIDYESMPGETKQAKIRALVLHHWRRRTLQIFIEFLEGDRPKEVWRVKDTGDSNDEH